MNDNHYLSVIDLVESKEFPFSIGQIRSFLLNRHKNGLDKAVRKVGRRIYLRKDLFLNWLESQISN